MNTVLAAPPASLTTASPMSRPLALNNGIPATAACTGPAAEGVLPEGDISITLVPAFCRAASWEAMNESGVEGVIATKSVLLATIWFSAAW